MSRGYRVARRSTDLRWIADRPEFWGPGDPSAVKALKEKTMAETREESLKRFAEEDKKFEELKASDTWPARTCAECQKNTCQQGKASACTVCCCQRSHHFTGGLCLHCGMDERRVPLHR